MIFLHERYGVQQHTKDLTFKLAQAGYVGFSPDLLSRFTGDRKSLEWGEARVELRDNEVVDNLGESVDYLKGLPAVDASRIGVVGVCQTGRSSLLFAAHRLDISGCVVIYGAVGTREWETNEHRPESISNMVERLSFLCWESSARQIILFLLTMCSDSAAFWSNTRKLIISVFTMMLPMDG